MQNSLDTKSIDNIIEKLQIHMQRNNQTMHGLASCMGFDYQPFYRLMTKKSLPTISSLGDIAQKLNCYIAELIADNIFLDIPGFNDITAYLAETPSYSIRIYLSKDIMVATAEFIAIKTDLDKTEHSLNNISYYPNTNIYQLFIITSKIDIDGFFLVKYKNDFIILEVLSVSSKLISSRYGGKRIQIPVEQLEVYAKFVHYVELPNPWQSTLSGKTI